MNNKTIKTEVEQSLMYLYYAMKVRGNSIFAFIFKCRVCLSVCHSHVEVSSSILLFTSTIHTLLAQTFLCFTFLSFLPIVPFTLSDSRTGQFYNIPFIITSKVVTLWWVAI